MSDKHNTINFPPDFHQFLNEQTLVEIMSGPERTSFTEIWMVNSGDRVFARSWNKNPAGWMNSFIRHGGKVKYGNRIIDVIAVKIDVTDPINLSISKAYLNKYTQHHNLEYARAISHSEYFDFTIEFFCIA